MNEGLLPSGLVQARERAQLEARVNEDVEALVRMFLADGKEATKALFDSIAKRRKFKNFEAHMLIIGFQRVCRERGITF